MNLSKTVTRRRFLTTAATACSAPLVVPGSAMGLEDRPAPSERITTGYIGVGPRGLLNVREQLTCADAQVVAVCDVWKHCRDRAKLTVDNHYKNADCKTYVDFREILQRDDIDAVGIGTPDHWHVPIAVMAAKAGKDVSVEKPLGVSVQQDQICREVMKRYDRVFQYGTEARAQQACRLGAELVRNGRIGKIKEIRVKSPDSRGGGSRVAKPVPPELDYELWLGPAPWRPYSGCPNGGNGWYHVYDYALGFIAGWGAHPLDLLVWAFDTHLAGNWEVEGTGVIHAAGCNDAVTKFDATLNFASGVTMNYWATGLPKDEHPRLKGLGNYAQLIGEDGWIAIYYANMMCEPESIKADPLGPADLRLTVSAGQERNFIECCKTRQTTVTPVDDAVHSDLISHICDIAIRAEHKITWDPVKEEIIGDAEASGRLSRAMRDPWRL